jgi:hypothetical protein
MCVSPEQFFFKAGSGAAACIIFTILFPGPGMVTVCCRPDVHGPGKYGAVLAGDRDGIACDDYLMVKKIIRGIVKQRYPAL